jgi:hypothetical protein
MAWQNASGFKVEVSPERYKGVIGNALRSRTDRTEATQRSSEPPNIARRSRVPVGEQLALLVSTSAGATVAQARCGCTRRRPRSFIARMPIARGNTRSDRSTFSATRFDRGRRLAETKSALSAASPRAGLRNEPRLNNQMLVIRSCNQIQQLCHPRLFLCVLARFFLTYAKAHTRLVCQRLLFAFQDYKVRRIRGSC